MLEDFVDFRMEIQSSDDGEDGTNVEYTEDTQREDCNNPARKYTKDADTQSTSLSIESIQASLLTPEGVSHDNDQSREHRPDALPPVHPKVQRLSSGPSSPRFASRQPFVRQFSIQSRRRSFMVTDYGPQSVDRSLESVFSSNARQSVVVFPEEISTESGVQVTQSTSCIMDMSQVDDVDNEMNGMLLANHDQVRTYQTTAFSITGTIPSLVSKPKNKRQQIALEIAKRGRLFAKRKKDRLVEKNGECRIVYTKVRNRSYRLLHDFFTTMLELKWRYHFLVFTLAFALSWVVFGLVWWGLASFEAGRIPEPLADGGFDSTAVEPCIVGVTDYTTALLFSIETQQTIGYGTRAITSSCPLAITIMMLQSMLGVIIQCILTGIIFAKLARPKRRAQTILFSKNAVVCERDGQRTLVFRVGDIRRSQILATSVHVMLTERRTTREGECLPIATRELRVTTESGGEFFFLAWPIEVLHKIDRSSPLWELSEFDLIQQDWEFIVVLEGVAEATGASFQVRTSYLPSEVLWGHRLKSLLNKSSGGVLEIDYTHFHETEPVKMSERSARKTKERLQHLTEVSKNNNDRNKDDANKQDPGDGLNTC
ncbi:hypothetical protein LSH36_1587g00064 [Paralvinella palmiformis]|uniref:Uncharacterized protein n=1 Tax=Paralvinella palmiformis TaxID=53620 RepID=A0AAD9MR16_9ANNE|nr:hypothetical protein LSH36_1587g00064 [Paralvinella palmiformis]